VPIGVADTSGNLLDGNDDGSPGGVFMATFALGHQFNFQDGNWNAVSLRLSGGGSMVLTRRGNGDAWQLSLLNNPPERSTLTGQVRKIRAGATGLTTIGSIVSGAAFHNRLTDPPFLVGSQPRSSVALDPAPVRRMPVRFTQVKPSARPVHLGRFAGFGPHRSAL
jgi:hypothetical protein